MSIQLSGVNQSRFVINPGKQLLARGFQAQLGRLAVEVNQRRPVRHDFGAQVLEDLQAINMVGVVMRDQHVRDGQRRDFFDLCHQPRGQRRRTQGVNQHHPRRGNDKTRV